MIRTLVVATAVILGPQVAAAQDRPVISLAVPDPARWDIAGFAGWAGVNQSGIAIEWNEWGDAPLFGASVGYYWTPHVKVDVSGAATAWSSVRVQRPPTENRSSFLFGERRSMSQQAAVALQYQFRQNAWFHPFAGAGLVAVRESAELDVSEQPLCPSFVFCPPVQLPREESVSSRVRPLAQAGFKWYLAERAFVRSEVRLILGSSGLASAQWHAGAGVDF